MKVNKVTEAAVDFFTRPAASMTSPNVLDVYTEKDKQEIKTISGKCGQLAQDFHMALARDGNEELEGRENHLIL